MSYKYQGTLLHNVTPGSRPDESLLIRLLQIETIQFVIADTWFNAFYLKGGLLHPMNSFEWALN